MVFFKQHIKRQVRGFTLPEMLLSVALLTIIGGMIIPSYHTFIVRNDLDIATITLASNLRRAQSLSRSSDGDMTWGVHVGVGSILIYKGPSYVGRDVTYDENTQIPKSIVPTGVTEITFSKVIGTPSATGTFMLTTQVSEKRTLTINEKGMVNY
jgi:prepilin-type N-terminal cleavage/methylation domain-containing protein